jgi:hypothetical protein
MVPKNETSTQSSNAQKCFDNGPGSLPPLQGYKHQLRFPVPWPLMRDVLLDEVTRAAEASCVSYPHGWPACLTLPVLSSLSSLPAGSPVVYLPTHRSHLDYLLLSYVLFSRDITVPHIAAGDNLQIPLLGGVMRKGGAFFMRRSIRGSRDENVYKVGPSEGGGPNRRLCWSWKANPKPIQIPPTRQLFSALFGWPCIPSCSFKE